MARREKLGLTQEQIYQIREIISDGSLDSRAIALDFNTSTDVIHGLRAGLQAEWTACGKGRLPVPAPSESGYKARPFTEADKMLRDEFVSDKHATIVFLAAKYGMTQSRARYVLDREPSVLGTRIRAGHSLKMTLFSTAVPYLKEAKLTYQQISDKCGRSDWAVFITEMRNDSVMGPECRLYDRRAAYNRKVFILPANAWRPTFEQFDADWTLIGGEPHYEDGVLKH